jgi:L-lactate utilization protein LutB
MSQYYSRIDVYIKSSKDGKVIKTYDSLTPLRSNIKNVKEDVLKVIANTLKKYGDKVTIGPYGIYFWRASHNHPQVHGRYIFNHKKMKLIKDRFMLFDVRKQKSAI